jgi:hypothetical protein
VIDDCLLGDDVTNFFRPHCLSPYRVTRMPFWHLALQGRSKSYVLISDPSKTHCYWQHQSVCSRSISYFPFFHLPSTESIKRDRKRIKSRSRVAITSFMPMMKRRKRKSAMKTYKYKANTILPLSSLLLVLAWCWRINFC